MTLYFTCEFLIQGCACVIGAHSEAMSPRPSRCFDEAGLDIKFADADEKSIASEERALAKLDYDHNNTTPLSEDTAGTLMAS